MFTDSSANGRQREDESEFMILNATFVLASGSGQSAFVVFALLAAALIGGGVAVWAIQRAFTRRRTDGMKTATQEIGFTFEGDEWADPRHAPMLETSLFGKGRSEGFR